MTIQESVETKCYAELAEIYRCLEEELIALNPGCKGCGTCCRFSVFDHVLYASNIEVDYVTSHREVSDFDIQDNVCPFLINNQCAIRDFRTLGCRVFYCNPRYKDTSQDIYEKYYRMIKDLSKKYTITWEYQPFLKHLAKFKEHEHVS